jgi:hypothetical protein
MAAVTPADQAKAQKLANYDRQIERLQRKLDKLVEHRMNFVAEWGALGASKHLPDDFNPLRAVEAWLIEHGVKPAVFGRRYFNDPRFVFDLRKGRKLNALNQRKVRLITSKPPREG